MFDYVNLRRLVQYGLIIYNLKKEGERGAKASHRTIYMKNNDLSEDHKYLNSSD